MKRIGDTRERELSARRRIFDTASTEVRSELRSIHSNILDSDSSSQQLDADEMLLILEAVELELSEHLYEELHRVEDAMDASLITENHEMYDKNCSVCNAVKADIIGVLCEDCKAVALDS